jgi:hypothetical protein
MLGLFLLGLGALLWVSADMRDEWRKLDAIDRHLVETGALPSYEVPAPDNRRASDTREAISAVEPRELYLR